MLSKRCRNLADKGVNILAFQSFPNQGKSTIRLVGDNPTTTKTALDNQRLSYTETQVTFLPCDAGHGGPWCQWVRLIGGVGTILCIDDQTYALAARVESLRAQGHIVIVVGSPQAALDSLLTNPIEAAVIDCHMAGALLVADLLKRIRPELPIIMLASYCAVPCHRRAVTACIGKGEPAATLLRALRMLLDSNAPGQKAA